MSRRILVTAATGTVGRHVVAELADRDVVVRAASRDPDRAGETLDADEFVALDFEDRDTWEPALADVDGVFLVRPPVVGSDPMGGFVEAASAAGVEQVAYLSALGAEKNALIPHHRIEKAIAASGVEYTFLRASFFAQNLFEVHRHGIVEHGEILVPAGTGTTSFVDARDVAAVAAVVLTEPGHENRAYDLTGAEALSYHAVAAVLREVLDRPVTYPEPSILEFVSYERTRGQPLVFVLLMVGIYTTARVGLAGRVTDDVERILGRPPRDVRAFAEDYADEFRATREVSAR